MTRPAWAPTPAQVGALMPKRFPRGGPSDTSSPTADQVLAVVDMLLPGFLAETGPISQPREEQAATALALGAAAYLENSFWPEQNQDVTNANAVFFRNRYQEQLALLARGSSDTSTTPAGAPRGSFPVVVTPWPYC